MAKTLTKDKKETKTTALYKQTVSLRFLHVAPRKVRRVSDSVVGLPVNEAEAQLIHQPGRPAQPLLKLVRSAVANAKEAKANPDKLLIESIRVDQGPMLKRYLPRAHGRATPIQKKMSHVTLTVAESEALGTPKFTITLPAKDKKSKKKEKSDKVKRQKEKEREAQPRAEKKREGFLKRIFRRKSV